MSTRRISAPLPGSKKGSTVSDVFRNPNFPDLLHLPFPDDPTVDTPYKLFARSANKYGSNPFLGEREKLAEGQRGDYIFDTYEEVLSQVTCIAQGLQTACGLAPSAAMGGGGTQARAAIFSVNRPEWTKSMLALWGIRAVCVPLYETLGRESTSFILEQSEASVVIVERSKFHRLLASHDRAIHKIKYIVMFEEPSDSEQAQAQEVGIGITSISQLELIGRQSLGDRKMTSADLPAGAPDDWGYIMYTSGTTGNPKGVVLTNKNCLASASATHHGMSKNPGGMPFMRSSDVYCSYLPLPHSFEAMMQICCMGAGARVGFFSGDVLKLVSDDIPRLKPTVFAGVPRIYNRLFDKVMAGIDKKGGISKLLFNLALNNQSWTMRWMGFRWPLWDMLVFAKVKSALGGRVRWMVSGAAPLSAQVHHFLQVCMGCPVVQGYGMTENFAAAVVQPFDFTRVGTIGAPIPSMEVRLVDTEFYKNEDRYPDCKDAFESQVTFKGVFDPSLAGESLPRGELQMRGPSVFHSYYMMPKETAEAKDEGGWLHTGDIAQMNTDGSISIIDRMKDIFKLSHGEYVAPEVVEQSVTTSKYIAQIWVYGCSDHSNLVAVVAPEQEAIKSLAMQIGVLLTSVEQLCENAQIRSHVLADIKSVGKAAGLRSFEIPKIIYLDSRSNTAGQVFTVENELLTPTFKLRRMALRVRYREVLDGLFEEMHDDTASTLATPPSSRAPTI